MRRRLKITVGKLKLWQRTKQNGGRRSCYLRSRVSGNSHHSLLLTWVYANVRSVFSALFHFLLAILALAMIYFVFLCECAFMLFCVYFAGKSTHCPDSWNWCHSFPCGHTVTEIWQPGKTSFITLLFKVFCNRRKQAPLILQLHT